MKTSESIKQEPPVVKGVLTLSGYGLRLAVERGHLIVEDGVGDNRRAGRFPRVGTGIERVIVLGHSGTVSLEALRWLHEIGAAFIQIGPDGELIASGAPNAIKDVRVRRGQAVAMLSDSATDVARQLIVEKVSGQYALLDLIEDVRENRNLVEEALDRLKTAESPEALTFWESRAAAAYWNAWENVPITFPRRDAKAIPAHWRFFGTRSSMLSSSPRKAASPGNALLNYLYAILEAESLLAAIAVGCDPAMGIVHTDKPSRNSFACDLMEPARPHVDLYLLKLLRSQTFTKSDFFETRDGNCRLMPELTRPLAATASRWGKAVAPWAEKLAGDFSRMPLAMRTASVGKPDHGRHRTPLTQRNRSRPKAPRQQIAVLLTEPSIGARCKECGVALADRTRTYCNSCLPKNAGIASKKAVETGALLRAIGEDRRSSPEARAKHKASAILQNGLNREWEAKHREIPSPAVFREEILPRLKGIPVGELKKASGLSTSSCKKIRAGNLVPHPRHWDAMKVLYSPVAAAKRSS